jgi:acetyltransferase-like isoleucine patch superfamily enzyme
MRFERARRWLAGVSPDGYGYLPGGGWVFPPGNAHLVDIPRGTPLNGTVFNAWDPIVLEPGVVLGHDVMFLTGRHEVTPSGVDADPTSRGPITVRRGAWVASRAVILGGVEIGEASVIGAGSIVTHSIPSREFWAGNPARRIRAIE